MKIDIPDGWRRRKIGETICRGDKATHDRGITWNEVTLAAGMVCTKSHLPIICQNKAVIPDKITTDLCAMLKERSKTGFANYKKTMDRDDLKPSEWAQHALEESMDKCKYLLKLKRELEAIGK